MTAPAAPTPDVARDADAFRAHVAKRIRWAQHTRRAADADQVAGEVLAACLAQINAPHHSHDHAEESSR